LQLVFPIAYLALVFCDRAGNAGDAGLYYHQRPSFRQKEGFHHIRNQLLPSRSRVLIDGAQVGAVFQGRTKGRGKV